MKYKEHIKEYKKMENKTEEYNRKNNKKLLQR